MDKKNYWEITTRIIFYFSSLVVIFLLIWGIFGNSPTFEELVWGFVIMLVGYLLNLNTKIAKLEVHSNITQNTLRKVGEKFEQLKEKIDKLNENIKEK